MSDSTWVVTTTSDERLLLDPADVREMTVLIVSPSEAQLLAPSQSRRTRNSNGLVSEYLNAFPFRSVVQLAGGGNCPSH